MPSILKFKNIALVMLVILLGIQFIRIDKSNPPLNPSEDFIAVSKPPENVTLILKKACYDCHSNETVYPWYSNIAPASWWLKSHIDEAREALNFSEWTDYSGKEKSKKIHKAAEEVKEGAMPLSSYTLIHFKSKLSNDEKATLSNYFHTLTSTTPGTESEMD